MQRLNLRGGHLGEPMIITVGTTMIITAGKTIIITGTMIITIGTTIIMTGITIGITIGTNCNKYRCQTSVEGLIILDPTQKNPMAQMRTILCLQTKVWIFPLRPLP